MRELLGNDGKTRVVSPCCYAETYYKYNHEEDIPYYCGDCGQGCHPILVEKYECPMCEPGTCPGGAHRNALWEDGIRTREQYLAMCKNSQENT